MGRITTTDNSVAVSTNSTKLVPVGSEFNSQGVGARWAEGETLLLRSEYPVYSEKFPDNITTEGLFEKEHPLSTAKKIISLPSRRLVLLPDSALDPRITYSDDNGSSWVIKDTGLSEISENYIISSTGRIILFHSTSVTSLTNNVAYSDDEGTTWTLTSSNIAGILKVSVALSGRIIVHNTSGSNNFAYSDDDGATWSISTIPIVLQNMLVTSTGRLIGGGFGLSTTNNVVYSDNEGVTWVLIDSVVVFSFIKALHTNSTNRIFAGNNIQASNNFSYSDDDGLTWTTVTSNVGAVQVIETLTNNNMISYDNTGTNSFAYSTDNGATWTANNTNLSDMTIIETNTGRLIGFGINGATNLEYSDDDGATWTQVTTGISGNLVDIGITSYKRIFIISNSSSTDNIGFSDNDGLTWTLFSTSRTNLSKVDISNDDIPFFSYVDNEFLHFYWIDVEDFIFIEPPATVGNFIRIT